MSDILPLSPLYLNFDLITKAQQQIVKQVQKHNMSSKSTKTMYLNFHRDVEIQEIKPHLF